MTVKEIVLLVILLLSLALLVSVFIVIRKIENYRSTKMNEVLNAYKEYYLNLKVKDHKLVPYHEENGSVVEFKFKSKGEVDPVTNVSLNKHYVYFKELIYYMGNDKLGYDFDFETIDNQKYIILNDKIKTIQVLTTFGNKETLLIKYKVIKNEDSYSLEIDNEEVKLDEE